MPSRAGKAAAKPGNAARQGICSPDPLHSGRKPLLKSCASRQQEGGKTSVPKILFCPDRSLPVRLTGRTPIPQDRRQASGVPAETASSSAHYARMRPPPMLCGKNIRLFYGGSGNFPDTEKNRLSPSLGGYLYPFGTPGFSRPACKDVPPRFPLREGKHHTRPSPRILTLPIRQGTPATHTGSAPPRLSGEAPPRLWASLYFFSGDPARRPVRFFRPAPDDPTP